MFTIIGIVEGTSNVLIASDDGNIQMFDFKSLNMLQLNSITNLNRGKIQDIEKIPTYNTQRVIVKNPSMVLICESPVRVVDNTLRVYTLSDAEYMSWRKRYTFYDYRNRKTKKMCKGYDIKPTASISIVNMGTSTSGLSDCKEVLHINNAKTVKGCYGGKYYCETIEDLIVELVKEQNGYGIRIRYTPSEYRGSSRHEHSDKIDFFMRSIKQDYRDDAESCEQVVNGIKMSIDRVIAKSRGYGYTVTV